MNRKATDAQSSIDAFQKACVWSETMCLKVVKCRSLAYRKFTKRENSIYTRRQKTMYSCYDPLLRIDEQPIPFVGDDDPPLFKYLGFKIQFDFKDNLIREHLTKQLEQWLDIVDTSLLTGPQKAWIANHLICHKVAWALLIHEFSASHADDWAKLVHRFYRKWMGLAYPAEPQILYRANTNFGLNFKHLGAIHRQLQIVKWHIMKHSS